LPSSFTEKGGTVTAPTGAVFGRVEIYFYLASGWLNVDDVSVTPTTTTNISETLYYSFGGDTVAMRVDGELSWIFSDQLGSTGITYQADGSGTSRQFYYPFGGIRNLDGAPVVDTDVGFTGQRLDASTGLMFYQARYYDPLTARFISADTIVPDPGNPQDFNRYTYVRNNPLGYVDPSGNFPILDCVNPFEDATNGCGGGSLVPEVLEDNWTKVVAGGTCVIGNAFGCAALVTGSLLLDVGDNYVEAGGVNGEFWLESLEDVALTALAAGPGVILVQAPWALPAVAGTAAASVTVTASEIVAYKVAAGIINIMTAGLSIAFDAKFREEVEAQARVEANLLRDGWRAQPADPRTSLRSDSSDMLGNSERWH
jgi:RHS repeat-associated protein